MFFTLFLFHNSDFFLNSTPYSTSNAQLAEDQYWNIRITLTEIMHNALNFKLTV